MPDKSLTPGVYHEQKNIPLNENLVKCLDRTTHKRCKVRFSLLREQNFHWIKPTSNNSINPVSKKESHKAQSARTVPFDKVSQVIGWNRGIHHGFTGEYVVNDSRAVCLERRRAFLWSFDSVVSAEYQAHGTNCSGSKVHQKTRSPEPYGLSRGGDTQSGPPPEKRDAFSVLGTRAVPGPPRALAG